MQLTPIYTEVIDGHTFKFFTEPWQVLKAGKGETLMSLPDNFMGECSGSLSCDFCIVPDADCDSAAAIAKAFPTLVELYPEYFI